MFPIPQLSHKLAHCSSSFYCISRSLCSNINGFTDGFQTIEKHLIGDHLNNSSSNFSAEEDEDDKHNVFNRASFITSAKSDAIKALKILQQDGPGFDTKSALNNLEIELSGILVREVLIGILKNINHVNRDRCAKLGYKFFIWSGQKDNYNHTVNAYHLMMQIFAESKEYKAMWRLVDEMTEKGYQITSRTFNILISSFGEAGVSKTDIERLIKSKSVNFRPFRDCFNAILHSLLVAKQYKLIEWVYHQMLTDGKQPDALTYNIIMYTKYRLGNISQFNRLFDEMMRNGFRPDFHTYNILLHYVGKVNKPVEAVDLLTQMKKDGIKPTVIHFTTLIDGLSRAGNMEYCRYFFDNMINNECEPDVVTYTIMIKGYIATGRLEKAEELFLEMFDNGKIPNVYTYNVMIRGLCIAGKFEYACLMLKEMELKGCNPNFLVYSTLVDYLWKARKISEANEVIKQMVEKGRYTHRLRNMMRYKRW